MPDATYQHPNLKEGPFFVSSHQCSLILIMGDERTTRKRRPFRFKTGLARMRCPPVSEKVGGTGLRTPPWAGAASKRNVQATASRANGDGPIANYPAKWRNSRERIKRMRVPGVAEGLFTLCVSLVSPLGPVSYHTATLFTRMVLHIEASHMGWDSNKK
ncbi:hypothetical protein PG993_004618 [Apiospora rasikravindrae]|uniref:Uncharacterized protein n=1 Tax=Apiospora rasikravindrae TaxID=990691 RepID=A0ABR1TDC2_9PEZI